MKQELINHRYFDYVSNLFYRSSFVIVVYENPKVIDNIWLDLKEVAQSIIKDGGLKNELD